MSHKKETWYQQMVAILPGLLVCILIAIVSKIMGHFIPALGAATISIFAGILIGNTIGKQNCLHRGTKFSEGTLLSISVVLLGATLSITSIFKIGITGFLFIVIQMVVTVIAVIWIGRCMKFGLDFSLLMASGNAVCGSSAVASTAPVIGAHSRDKGISITMINVAGTVLMIVLPLLTSLLYGNALLPTSAMLGGILQSVGQVVAAGSMVNEEVKDLALIFKIVRVILLVGIVFLLAVYKRHSLVGAVELVEEEVHSHTHQSRIRMPWYIKGFFVTCMLYTIGIIPKGAGMVIKELDNFLEVVALAGIGMRVNLADLMKQGPKVSLYCLLIAIVQVVVAILLIGVLL